MRVAQLTYAGSSDLRAGRSRTVREVFADETFVLIAVAGLVIALAAALPLMVVPDTWLAFVDGRWVADHGLPHTDSMAVLSRGATWVDQQWLAHLTLYAVVRVGGVKLVLLAAVLVDLVAAAIAAVAARSQGASPRSTALCLLAAFVVAPWLLQARTQTLALPLFVAVYALLCLDGRSPSRRVYVVLPLLVLWANVHGSAALGVALVFLYGLLTLRRGRVRGLVLAVVAPACLLASPYGFDLVGYYRRMLIGSPLPDYIDEWAPTKLEPDTLAFFALLFTAVYLLARHARVVTLFERIALPALIFVGLLAGRNTGWLGLGFVVSGPFLVDAAWTPTRDTAPHLQRLNRITVAALAAVAALVVATRVAQPTSSLLSDWPADAANAAAVAAGADGRVLADDLHSDWLLWTRPELSGRIAYDVRFELLDESQLAALQRFRDGNAPSSFVARYRVLTLESEEEASRLDVAGRVVYRSPELVVVERPAP
jgi:hypothetical protein